MAIIAELIELQTHRETTTLLMSKVERFDDGSGYRCDLKVSSGGFSCDRPFYFSNTYLVDAIKSLLEMKSGKSGVATLKGEWDKDFISLEMNRFGHVQVSGEILEYSESVQSLKFSFRTDQTVLEPFIRDLEALLNNGTLFMREK